MALAAGSQHMNLIVPAAGGAANGSGSKGVPPVSLAAGSTATFLAMAATDAAGFSAGSVVTVDAGLHGANGIRGQRCLRGLRGQRRGSQQRSGLHSPRLVQRCPGRVEQLDRTPAGAAADRGRANSGDAGSADCRLCRSRGRKLLPGMVGVVCHRRRAGRAHSVSLSAPAIDGRARRRRRRRWSSPLERIALSATFRALPVTDANDGEQVVCFRSFLPSPATLI